MATNMRPALVGSSRIVCRHKPPAPGAHADPVPWVRRPDSSCQVCPPSVGAEQRRVFDAGVDRIRIRQRRLEVPDALELPRVRRAVVPLVRAGHAVVGELVAHRLPRLCRRRWSAGSAGRTSRRTATRTAGSGRPAIPSCGRSPSPPKCGPLTSHFWRSAVRRQDERALACSHQHPYSAHRALLVVNALTCSEL